MSLHGRPTIGSRTVGGLRCKCGAQLPATWPHADQEGNGACLDCIGSEAKATWPGVSITSVPAPPGPEYVYLGAAGLMIEGDRPPSTSGVLSITRPTGGAYGREGKR